MASEETRPGADEQTRAQRIEALIEMMDTHDASGAAIEAESKSLGLSPAQLKKIRSARKTLDALMAEGLVPEGATL